MAIVFNGVREKYSSGLQRSNPPETIILHGTAGGGSGGKPGSPGGLLKWMMGGEREVEYTKSIGLFHYLIEQDSDVWEIINPDKYTYHSGTGGHTDSRSIGIELVNRDAGNMDEYAPEQYDALDTLLSELFARYPTINEITGHSAIYKRVKQRAKTLDCPGPMFKWDRVREMLSRDGHEFHVAPQRYYHIDQESAIA